MSATLNSILATSARVYLPAWGVWYAEVDLDGEHTLTGTVSLVVADLTLVGTVLSGGPENGRSHYRVVAGKGFMRGTFVRRMLMSPSSNGRFYYCFS